MTSRRRFLGAAGGLSVMALPAVPVLSEPNSFARQDGTVRKALRNALKAVCEGRISWRLETMQWSPALGRETPVSMLFHLDFVPLESGQLTAYADTMDVHADRNMQIKSSKFVHEDGTVLGDVPLSAYVIDAGDTITLVDPSISFEDVFSIVS